MIVSLNCSGCHRRGSLEVDALFDAVDVTCSCGHISITIVTVVAGQVAVDGRTIETVVA